MLVGCIFFWNVRSSSRLIIVNSAEFSSLLLLDKSSCFLVGCWPGAILSSLQPLSNYCVWLSPVSQPGMMHQILLLWIMLYLKQNRTTENSPWKSSLMIEFSPKRFVLVELGFFISIQDMTCGLLFWYNLPAMNFLIILSTLVWEHTLIKIFSSFQPLTLVIKWQHLVPLEIQRSCERFLYVTSVHIWKSCFHLINHRLWAEMPGTYF